MSDVTSAPGKGKAPSLFDDLMDLVESVLVSVFVVLLVFTFLCRIATVEGDSMLPTLHNGDRLILSNLGYTPEHGDIVIFNCDSAYTLDAQNQPVESPGLGKRLVKRVIATEGQQIQIDFQTGTVTLDGEVLTEPFLNTPTTWNAGAFAYPLTVPEGYVFVMGDNRNDSRDSRDPGVGLVDVDSIVGKVLFRAYPLSKLGTVDQ